MKREWAPAPVEKTPLKLHSHIKNNNNKKQVGGRTVEYIFCQRNCVTLKWKGACKCVLVVFMNQIFCISLPSGKGQT